MENRKLETVPNGDSIQCSVGKTKPKAGNEGKALNGNQCEQEAGIEGEAKSKSDWHNLGSIWVQPRRAGMSTV